MWGRSFSFFPRSVIWHPKDWQLKDGLLTLLEGRKEGAVFQRAPTRKHRSWSETPRARRKRSDQCGGDPCVPSNWRSTLNDLKATSCTFHRRMGDFPRRFVRSRWWRISAAVPFTATTTRLTTTSESEITESTAHSLPCRCASLCGVMVSAWLRCSSSASAPSFTSWTEDLLKSCWTSGSISVRTFHSPLLAAARHLRDSFKWKAALRRLKKL